MFAPYIALFPVCEKIYAEFTAKASAFGADTTLGEVFAEIEKNKDAFVNYANVVEEGVAAYQRLCKTKEFTVASSFPPHPLVLFPLSIPSVHIPTSLLSQELF